MNYDWQPLLENDLLILRPLANEDFDQLYKVASDPLIWEQHPAKDRCERTGFEPFFKEAIDSKGAFVVIDKKTAEVIGSSRFTSVNENKNAISIGWTFLSRQYWGGKYNSSMKRAMMDYAFRFVDNILFYVNETNFRSQKAVEKIGGRRTEYLDNQVLAPRANATVIYIISKRENLAPSFSV